MNVKMQATVETIFKGFAWSKAWNATVPTKDYFPSLDGVRLLAIGLVVLHHSLGAHHGSAALRLLAIQNGNGVGVPLFLILSGFLLTTILLNTRNKVDRYKTFLSRRASRILPLYFAYLVGAFVLTRISTGLFPSHFWIYALFLQGYFPRVEDHIQTILPLYHFWTLGVQEQFYFLWPFIVWGFEDLKSVKRLCWAGIILSAVARMLSVGYLGSHPHLVELLPYRVGEMCLGGLLAVDLKEGAKLFPYFKAATIPSICFYMLWAWKGLSFGSPMGFVVGLQLVTFACGGLIIHCLDASSYMSKLFALKPLATIGKRYSYGVYIFHVLTLQVLSATSKSLGSIRYVLIVPVALFVVWASFNFYERHFLTVRVLSVRADRTKGAEAAFADLRLEQPIESL